MGRMKELKSEIALKAVYLSTLEGKTVFLRCYSKGAEELVFFLTFLFFMKHMCTYLYLPKTESKTR